LELLQVMDIANVMVIIMIRVLIQMDNSFHHLDLVSAIVEKHYAMITALVFLIPVRILNTIPYVVVILDGQRQAQQKL
jgi:hypothetical protein